MSKCYRSELVGVFGCPVDENPTGTIMEEAFAAKGLDYRYITMRVEKEDFPAAMQSIRALGMKGINLTIPHKVEGVRYLDSLSEAAEIIGAVNVIVNQNGSLWGENTDGKGFLKALTDEGISVKGKNILVLGAGGAARAISVECALAGARKVMIASRDRQQGETVCDLLKSRTKAEAEHILWSGSVSVPEETDILVNATNVGMFPNVDQKPDIRYDMITDHMAVCDVIFNDPQTLFLNEAKKRGAKTIQGLGMLVNQAALNFRLWTGEEAPCEIMVRALKKEFGLDGEAAEAIQ